MRRVLKPLGLSSFAALALAIGLAAPVQAQVVVIPSTPVVVAPQPVVSYYSYSAPVTYAVPRVSYYPAPVVTTYSPAPVVTTTYSAPMVTTYSAPVVTTYSAPVVAAPAPGIYTTYTYRNGLGIFRPRYVNQTYYTPVR